VCEGPTLHLDTDGISEIARRATEHFRPGSDWDEDDRNRQNPKVCNEFAQFVPSVRIRLNDDFFDVGASGMPDDEINQPLAMI
jgi:hypothetical protein